MTIEAPVAEASNHGSKRVRMAKLTRYAGYGAAWVLFITVARLIVPQSSQAAEGPGDFAPARAVGAAATGRGGFDVGTLVGREYLVRVTATESGPRYAVWSADGTLLHENLDARALAESFPMLDLGTKQADPTRLMSADADE